MKSSIVTSEQLDWCIHGICHERKRSIHQSLTDYFSYNKASGKKTHDMHVVIKETFFFVINECFNTCVLIIHQHVTMRWWFFSFSSVLFQRLFSYFKSSCHVYNFICFVFLFVSGITPSILL